MIRRINLWGAPNTGKTTMTSWIYAQMKIDGHNIEISPEQAKRWAVQKRPIVSFDQLLLTTLQANTEDEFLRSGTEFIITDCPILIGYVYGQRDKLSYAPILLQIGREVEKIYPSVNVLLKRVVPYKKEGRYETEEEALSLDEQMMQFVYAECETVIEASPKEPAQLLHNLYSVMRH